MTKIYDCGLTFDVRLKKFVQTCLFKGLTSDRINVTDVNHKFGLFRSTMLERYFHAREGSMA